MSSENGNSINQALQGFGIIALALCSFLGMLYIRKGDMILTGIIILFGVLALFGLVYLLWKSKEARRNSGFGLKEVLLLLGIIILSFTAYIPIFHFSNLEFNSKEQVKRLGTQIAREIRHLPTEFDKQAKTEMTRMNVQLSNEDKSESFIEEKNEALLTSLSIVKQKLKKDSLKLAKNANYISQWNRFQLNEAFGNLDKIYLEHIKILKEGFENQTFTGWSGEFEYEPKFKAGEIISDPRIIKNNKDYKIDYFIPFVVCLCCTLLILTPYIRQKRGKVFKDLHRVD